VSYVLCIWDPERHPPIPTNAADALETMERLRAVSDNWYLTLSDFGRKLTGRYEADAQVINEAGGCSAFWGGDLLKSAAECKSAVYRLSIPFEECTRQISYCVDAAAELGLVVYDDEIGMCFLPDGTILPEDCREMWQFNLAEMKAGPADPNVKTPDGRTFLERLGGELWDAIGRGNSR
jgi:hypothetical protein